MGAKCTERGLGEKMKYLTEGLPKKQVNVLRKVAPQTSSSGFYLAGGTALAIYLAHRVSVDLDWFTPNIFEDGMLVAHCMKLSAIAQRGARKDFCDIYALGKKSFSLQEMLDLYQKKFNIRDIVSVLYGLVYFDDAESERMPRMLWDIKWGEIKKTILKWVKDLS